MKTAAKRDIQWELQKHETHQVVERICGSGSPVPIGCRVSLKNLILTVDLDVTTDGDTGRYLFAACNRDSSEVQGASLERTEYGHVGLVSMAYCRTSLLLIDLCS